MISSRAELHKLMEKTINRNLQSMEERGEYDEYSVKTNIIESNCSVKEIPLSFSDYTIEIKPTQDKFLYVLIVKKGTKKFSFISILSLKDSGSSTILKKALQSIDSLNNSRTIFLKSIPYGCLIRC